MTDRITGSHRDETDVASRIEAVYRSEAPRVLATLIRLVGDFDLAEDALQEALAAAVAQWPKDGVPRNPRAWLVSTGRFKAIDRMRRQARFDHSLPEAVNQSDAAADETEWDDTGLTDDRLRLIFTCCHPTLTSDARIALTLREVCGLTTEEIARAFLVAPSALAQRIVRAKRKIKVEGIPYEVPEGDELPRRLDSVLHVIYLIFNEGYEASFGDELTRPDLSGEAIHLGRLLVELMPGPEVAGLLALMLLHESRRQARTSPAGDIILLADQDRSRWDQALVDEGRDLVARAWSSESVGEYAIQAAISAVHAEAVDAGDTDWGRIVSLYNMLKRAIPSPIVDLNRAVAVAMRDGPAAGLALVDAILATGWLSGYHHAFAAKADLHRRLGQTPEARSAYQQALALTELGPERRFLERRLADLDGQEEKSGRTVE